MFDLRGEVALVTGSGGRLGPIWCQALEDAGAEVIRSDVDTLDVADVDSIKRFVGTLTKPVTILVNNAGVDSRPTDIAARYQTFHQMVRVNVLGTNYMTEFIGAGMAAVGHGSIINIASLYGLCSPDLRIYSHREDGWVKDPMYGATKAAIISLTRYYAAKWGTQGVRVNALAPGGVVAEGDSLTAQDPQFVEKYTHKIPMGRMCKPEDLAGPLVFLASQASSFVTGHCIPIDGGFLCL